MRRTAFLFDLDGVLIDSEREYTRIWNEIEKEFPTGKENFALSIKGQTLSKILDDNYPDPETREKVTLKLHFLEKQMKYEYCKGAEELLDTLKKEKRKTAVVTSSDEVKMAHLYSDIPDFREKVEVIIDASKVKKSKPDPEGYLKGAEALEAEINRSIVFEDSVQGVKAGRAAGAVVVGILGTKTREELAPYSDLVLENLGELDLMELLKKVQER